MKIPRRKGLHYFFHDFDNLHPFFLDTCGKSVIREVFVKKCTKCQWASSKSLGNIRNLIIKRVCKSD
jgi:hypothetical protein